MLPHYEGFTTTAQGWTAVMLYMDLVDAVEKNHHNHDEMEDDEDHAGDADCDPDDQTLQKQNNQKTLIFHH